MNSVVTQRNDEAVIDVSRLCVDGPDTEVLRGVSLAIGPGTRHAIVGPSGSGKTTLALAMVGRLRPGLVHRSGAVRVSGAEILGASGHRLRELRRQVAFMSQDPGVALTPTMSVRRLVTELADGEHGVDLLTALGLPTTAEFLARRPGELSGGQRRRVALARALAVRPRVLIVDEPSAGIDRPTVRQVVSELRQVNDEFGVALVTITHDLSIVAEVAEEITVLGAGAIVESGPVVATLQAGRSSTLRQLTDAVELTARARPTSVAGTESVGMQQNLLDAVNLTVCRAGERVPLVDPVSFAVGSGESVALLGASGMGKTTIARALVGLHPIHSGTLRIGGAPVGRRRDPVQARAVGLVPQDPATALNPRLRVGTSIHRALRAAGVARTQWPEETGRLLTAVGLDASTAGARPGGLSGGQRQRAALARALATGPRVIICDEVTSSLDPSSQETVLDLLDDLRARTGIGLIVITHEPAVARRMCTSVIALGAGGGGWSRSARAAGVGAGRD